MYYDNLVYGTHFLKTVCGTHLHAIFEPKRCVAHFSNLIWHVSTVFYFIAENCIEHIFCLVFFMFNHIASQ